MNIHRECAYLATTSQGGYSFDNVYFKMPSHYRKMHIQLVKDMITPKEDETTNVPNSKQVKIPEFAVNAKAPPNVKKPQKKPITKYKK